MVKGIYIMNDGPFNQVYPVNVREEIKKLVHITPPPQTRETIVQNPSMLQDAELIFSGWGCPKLDKGFLEAAPNLKALFHAAGSLKGIVTDSCWERDMTVTSAYAANAVPVAEYTLSQILFSLKYGWHYSLAMKRREKDWGKYLSHIPGAFGSTVGIISLGMVGRRVCELLKNFDIRVIAYDPFVSKEEAKKLNVELCSLEDIYRQSDIVSLHAPWLNETEGMIAGTHFEMMKPYATFINTARGAVVKETEMIEVLHKRSDIMAILDVTYPEPPVSDSRLYSLPNVILTPHIAGSEGKECGRMGTYMLEELKRYLKGEPLKWRITQENFSSLA